VSADPGLLASAYHSETITERLSDYGVDVAVSAPPAREVSPINLAQIRQGEGL
jgi:hypothetical protein